MDAVDVGVGDEEGVGVPPRDEEVLEDLLHAVLGEAEVLGADDGRGDHVEAERVGAVFLEHLDGVGVVLEALRHLLAVLGEDEAVDDDVAVRRLAEEAGAEHHERVEPAARLVEALGDEVGGVEAAGRGVSLAHVVLLGVGHGAGLEPAVEDFGGAVVGVAVAADDHLVDEVLVEVRDLLAGEGLELGGGADADHVGGVVVVDPDGEAGAPEAVARDVPVARLAEPVAEALLADVLGHPVDGVVVGGEAVVEVFDADVPGVDGAVDERRVGAVAEGVGVDDRRLVDELALGLEALDDVLVAVLAEAAGVVGDGVGEVAGGVERVDEGEHAVLLADAEVVLAVGRRLVDEARAVVGRDVVVVENDEGAFGLLVDEIREDWLVGPALEVGALEARDDLDLLVGLLEDVRQARLGHDVARALGVGEVARDDVVDVRAGADREVLRERPGGGGPDQEVNGGVSLLE